MVKGYRLLRCLRCHRNLRVLTQEPLYNLVQGLTFDPLVLKKLAAIDSFDLLVSTTFDNMMAKAIDAVHVSEQAQNAEY